MGTCPEAAFFSDLLLGEQAAWMASKAVEGVTGGDKNEKEKPLHNMPPISPRVGTNSHALAPPI